ETRADILARGLPEFARAHGIEAERDDRLTPAVLVESRLRVGQIAARYQNLLLEHIRHLRRARAHQHLVVRRQLALHRLVRRHALVDHPEFHLGGPTQEPFELGRILQARHLHQDTIAALALDHRLDRAELGDAALEDLYRLVEGLADPLGDGGRRHGEPDQPAAGVGDLEAALATGAEQTAK